MAFEFYGSDRIISLTSGTTDVAVKDCYEAWKEWVILDDNLKYAQAFRYVGGDALPGSKALGITYFLLNGWKIQPYSGDHTLNIAGNLYSEDGSSPFVKAIGNYSVMIISTVSSLVDSTVQQLPEIEYASYNGGISLDTVNGTDSTEYPYGTPSHPCKTIFNAHAINLVRGFNKIYLMSNITLNSISDGILKDFEIIGVGGYRNNKITISNTFLDDVKIENVTLSGACKLDSTVFANDCNIIGIEDAILVVKKLKSYWWIPHRCGHTRLLY